MKIAVYGAGAVGSYFGAMMVRAGLDVHFITRGAQLEAFRHIVNGPLLLFPTSIGEAAHRRSASRCPPGVAAIVLKNHYSGADGA